ncbi:MAG: hypothetical protein GY862_04625 [Gammaproteobacteria bacterium]|nr:hypothetical protein [Gammaproteobacteria bacterium]
MTTVMSKRTREKRKKSRKKYTPPSLSRRRTRAASQQMPLDLSGMGAPMFADVFPSVQTMCLTTQLRAETQAVFSEAAAAMDTSLLKDCSEDIERIKNVQTVEELVESASAARRLAEHKWYEQVRRFGSDAASPIAERLKNLQSFYDENDRDRLTERLIAGLRWCGAAGAEALLDCFDCVDDYGRSLICVMLGLLEAKTAGDRIWEYYQTVKNEREENFFVGALWGLICLEDKRAANALFDLAMEKHTSFYEFLGFASRAGDHRLAAPLLTMLLEKNGRENEKIHSEIMSAVICIAHRNGRPLIIEVLKGMGETLLESEDIADKIFAQPFDTAKSRFSLYHGESIEDSIKLPASGGTLE